MRRPRASARSRTAGTATLLCVISLLSIGCSKSAEKDADFQRVILPGFSIELPAGTVVSTSTLPTGGKHEIKLPDPTFIQETVDKESDAGRVSVHWTSQSYTQEEWKKLLMPTFVQAFNMSDRPSAEVLKEVSSGNDRWMYIIGDQRSPVGVGVINCDPSFSVILAFARYRDVERQLAQLRRIVESVQCAVTDANRARPVAATRLPGKFGRTPDPDIQLFQSLDGEQMAINFTPSDVQRDQTIYRKIMHSFLANVGQIEIPESQLALIVAGEPHPAGKSSLMRAHFPETGENLYIGTLYCAKLGLSLISLWSAPQAGDQLAKERLSQVGCPGDASTSTPAFASLAESACAAGETRFCGLKEMPE
jgi:hypothetical protein